MHLAPTIGAFTTQLDTGVRQYNEMVKAAAQLVLGRTGIEGLVRAMSRQRYRHELVARPIAWPGWAQAFDELGHLRARLTSRPWLLGPVEDRTSRCRRRGCCALRLARP